MYDLRSPLSVPPAALSALPSLDAAASATAAGGIAGRLPHGAAQLPPSLLSHRRFQQQRTALLRRAAWQHVHATSVEFQLLWWDKHASHPSDSKTSFWRPVPPQGCVPGIAQPSAGVVMRANLISCACKFERVIAQRRNLHGSCVHSGRPPCTIMCHCRSPHMQKPNQVFKRANHTCPLQGCCTAADSMAAWHALGALHSYAMYALRPTPPNHPPPVGTIDLPSSLSVGDCLLCGVYGPPLGGLYHHG